jgi:hypothetical protein
MIFMWFLHQKVILTKDNLSRRNWHESINHLFFNVPLLVLFGEFFNIFPSTNCMNMFGSWLNGVDKDTMARIQVDTSVVVWSI